MKPRFKKTLKCFSLVTVTAIALSLFLSFAITNKDQIFENRYVLNLKANVKYGREKLKGNYEKANLKKPVIKQENSEILAYLNLNRYVEKNPFSSVLSDESIVKDLKSLLGSKTYPKVLKSISRAEKVQFDEKSNVYTVLGTNGIEEHLSGIIQIKSTGELYVAYLIKDKVVYHSNDIEYSKTVIDTYHMNEWIQKNHKSEIVYKN